MTLKLKRTPGLYLVGFMASGKSTVGKTLAEEIGWSFVDIDAEIEQQNGITIAEMFRTQGESFFREVERNTIVRHVAQIQSGLPTVVALGGGAFAQLPNRELLENNGVTIWLDCPFAVILGRLNGDTTRPLAANRERLAQLYEDRRVIYSEADYRVAIEEQNVGLIVKEILRLPLF